MAAYKTPLLRELDHNLEEFKNQQGLLVDKISDKCRQLVSERDETVRARLEVEIRLLNIQFSQIGRWRENSKSEMKQYLQILERQHREP